LDLDTRRETVEESQMPVEVTFPESLDAERLVLCRYSSADAQSIFELVDKNRDRLIQNFPNMAKDLSQIEKAKSFIVEKTEQWNARKSFCYAIWLKSSKEQIGQLQVKNVVWDVPSAELSYFVGSSSQRQGFASEAISAILRLAFERLDFRRIFVRIIPSNKESILLANKLGFKQEGLHRNEFRCGFGELHDVHHFSLTIEDYRVA
jgi:RimJ/RimL family protein N-acetyltransferase